MGDESIRLKQEEGAIRRRIASNRADVGRLLEVLKSMGAKALSSVQGELERLEDEDSRLAERLKEITAQQNPVERINDNARSFIEPWQDVGELIAAASPEEQRELLQHYIEVIELHATDPKGNTGTYALQLFPEVRPDRGFDWEVESNGAKPYAENENGDEADQDSIAVLTLSDGLFEQPSEKLPETTPNATFFFELRFEISRSWKGRYQLSSVH